MIFLKTGLETKVDFTLWALAQVHRYYYLIHSVVANTMLNAVITKASSINNTGTVMYSAHYVPVSRRYGSYLKDARIHRLDLVDAQECMRIIHTALLSPPTELSDVGA